MNSGVPEAGVGVHVLGIGTDGLLSADHARKVMEKNEVLVYGRELCADTTRARAVLDARAVAYRYIDVGLDDASRADAQALAKGSEKIPVIVLAGDRILVEPSDAELTAAL